MASVALLFDQVIYPFLWLLFISWIFFVFRSLRVSREQIGLGLSALILTAVVFTMIHTKLRIFADEVNLMASSQALYLFGRAAYVTEGIWHGQALIVLSSELDPRPLYFPFLVHLAHLIRNYSIINVFLINTLSLVLLLVAIGHTFLRRFGIWTALAAQLLILSQPIVLLGATSGGFELFFCATLFLVLALADSFIVRPSATSFRALFYSGLILAHSRYEGVVYLVMIFGSLLFWRDFRQMILRPVQIAIISIVLLPVIIHRVLTIDQPPWLLKSGMFSVWNLIDNNLTFLRSLIHIANLPFNPVLNLVGFCVIVCGTVANFIRNGNKDRGILAIALLSFWGSWIMVTAYAPSDIFEPVVQRYFISFSIFFALAALYPLTYFLVHTKKVVWALSLAALLFIISLTATKSFDQNQIGIFAQRFYFVKGFLEAIDPRETERPLIVGDAPKQYLILGHSAVSKDTFKQLWHDHRIPLDRQIYLVENEIKGRKVGSEISGTNKQELIAEQVLTTVEEPGTTSVKIYRIHPDTMALNSYNSR